MGVDHSKTIHSDFDVYSPSERSRQSKQRQLVTNKYDGSAAKPRPVRVEQKIGRNDPCPCGSGKKYKKCCGKV